MSAKTKTTTTTVNKDAGNGRFVTNEQVQKHPKTTYTQTVTKKSK